MPLDPELLKILACPACKAPLKVRGSELLSCEKCRKGYPVRDGIPVLLVDQAREI